MIKTVKQDKGKYKDGQTRSIDRLREREIERVKSGREKNHVILNMQDAPLL